MTIPHIGTSIAYFNHCTHDSAHIGLNTSFGETVKQGNVESPGKVCSHIFAVRFWPCVHHLLEEQSSVLEPGLEYPGND